MKYLFLLVCLAFFSANLTAQVTKIHNGTEPISSGQLNIGKSTTNTNAAETLLLLQRNTSGTAADGIGGSLLFMNQLSDGTLGNSGRISGITTDNVGGIFGKHALRFDAYNGISISKTMLLNSNGLGIGTENPTRLLHLEGGTTASGLLYSRVNYSGSDDVVAIEGESIPQDGYGIGGNFTGGYKAINADGEGGGYTGTMYGVYAAASGTTGTRIGLYARASGGTTNWAARFGPGNVQVQNDLEVQDFVQIGSATQNGRLDLSNINTATGANAVAARINVSHNGSETTYGSLITATNSGVGYTYGLRTTASNSSASGVAYGIHSTASGANDWAIYANGNNYFSGDVRIGTSLDPDAGAYKLVVDGKIIAEEMRIQNSSTWPDYVFEKNYDLMPLQELEKSIQENKHLPGIPTACEVEENGIAVGDMQKRMMEKIEELTLYVIQQQKEIDQLKVELKRIKH